jgi:molybdopterin synthase catalytic subunit
MMINTLVNGPVTLEIIAEFIGNISDRKDSGGHSVFLGQVRADENDGKKVRAIDYSAYDTMVEAEAEKIRQTVLSEFSDAKSIHIVHSKGLVNAGEISLFVIVSAGHRQQAFQACSRTVELIKERLPVWKREIYDDDSHKWK